MLTFTQYITELFSNHYNYQKSPKDGAHSYHFATENGSKMRVNVHHYNEHSKKNSVAHVDFENTESEHRNKMKINNSEGHSAAKVFSTIHHILKHHMDEHQHMKQISFHAAATEPTRVKLYSHFMKRFSNKHTEKKSAQGTAYLAHRDDFK